MVASCNCRLASCGDEREEEKKKRKKKEGKSTRGCTSAEAGKEEGRGAKRPEESERRGGLGRVEGIYIQRDQGEIEIETSGTTMAVEIRQGGGMEGNEGIRSCDCTKFAVRTAASFRRDRNMHW